MDMLKAKLPSINLYFKLNNKLARASRTGGAPLLFVHTVCLHLKQAFETVLKEVKLDIDVLEETVAL